VDAGVAARDESGGRFAAVTDDEILAAYRFLGAGGGVRRAGVGGERGGLLQSAENATLPKGRWWCAQ
jgi:threonine synthase